MLTDNFEDFKAASSTGVRCFHVSDAETVNDRKGREMGWEREGGSCQKRLVGKYRKQIWEGDRDLTQFIGNQNVP